MKCYVGTKYSWPAGGGEKAWPAIVCPGSRQPGLHIIHLRRPARCNLHKINAKIFHISSRRLSCLHAPEWSLFIKVTTFLHKTQNNIASLSSWGFVSFHHLIFCFPMFLSLEIFICTLVLLFQFLYLYMICDNYFISEIFKYLRMNVSKLFRKVRPSLSLWNLAQPLTWYFTWTTCVCSFSLPLASALSLQYNYSGWKATQKLLCQIAWNTLNFRKIKLC